jgi:hypothetical protein
MQASAGNIVLAVVMAGFMAAGFVVLLLGIGYYTWDASYRTQTRWAAWLGRVVSLAFLMAGVGGAILTAWGVWVGGYSAYN